MNLNLWNIKFEPHEILHCSSKSWSKPDYSMIDAAHDNTAYFELAIRA